MLSSFHCLLGLHVYDSRKCVHCTRFLYIYILILLICPID
nr:MAG TPA: hypothetical protein [Bacteriophage sp.]